MYKLKHQSTMESSLHEACKNGDLERVKLLIVGRKLDPTAGNENGRTPLHEACSGGHSSLAKVLIEDYKCDPQKGDIHGVNSLHETVRGGHLQLADQLVTIYKCDPSRGNCIGRNSLHFACERGDVDMSRSLITHGCCPNVGDRDGNSPLHLASLHGHLSLVQVLVDEFVCDPKVGNACGWSPLHAACNGGHIDIVRELVMHYGCNPMQGDENGNNPLHEASKYGHLPVVKMLVEELGCNPNVANKDGCTPLHEASCCAHVDIVKQLIVRYNCDPICGDNQGKTPVQYALESSTSSSEVIEYLMQQEGCEVRGTAQQYLFKSGQQGFATEMEDPETGQAPVRAQETIIVVPKKCDAPTMHQLQTLKGKGGRTVRVIKQIAHSWEQVAFALLFHDTVVKTIQKDNFFQAEPACRDMLSRWISGQVETISPISWDTIIEALDECGFQELTKELDAALS